MLPGQSLTDGPGVLEPVARACADDDGVVEGLGCRSMIKPKSGVTV
jgi:hypothetical protein